MKEKATQMETPKAAAAEGGEPQDEKEKEADDDAETQAGSKCDDEAGEGDHEKKGEKDGSEVSETVYLDMQEVLVTTGAIVIMHAKKHKERYNQQKALVVRLNARAAVLDIIEGPAKGTKRKAEYRTLKVVREEKALKQESEPSVAPAAPAVAPAASAASAAKDVPDELPLAALATPTPTDKTLELFGDLRMFE